MGIECLPVSASQVDPLHGARSVCGGGEMFTASEQFITQMKLRELRAQRDSALAAYEQLAREAAEAHDDPTRLRLLYEGLRRLRFAKQPLHPDVANLEPLLREIALGRASAETTTFWRTRLERELEQGRLRAAIVYLFRALLEEWAGQSGRQPQPSAEQRTARAELLLGASRAHAAPNAGALLTELFAAAELDIEQTQKHLRAAVDEDVYSRVRADELEPLLE